MGAKIEFTGDAAKLSAELAKVLKAEQAVTAQLQASIKESEKAHAAKLKEIEAALKAKAAAKEAAEEAKKLGNENEKLAKENDRLNEKLQRNAKSQESMFERGVIGARNMLAAYVSIEAAVGLVTKAVDHQRQQSEKSLTTTERIARAQRQVILNMPGASREQIQEVDSQIKDAARRSKTGDIASFYEGVAATSAATGGNIPSSIRAVEATSKVTRLAPDETPVIAAAAAEIAKNSGLTEEEAIGAVLQFGGVTRQADIGLAASAMVEGLAAASGVSADKGRGAEWALERQAAIANKTGDTTGRRTATATANLAIKLDKFFNDRPELQVADDLYAREEYLRQHPELAKEFLSKLGGETGSLVPITDMFTAGSDMHSLLLENEKAIDFSRAGQMYDTTVEGVSGGTSEIRTAEALVVAGGEAERTQLLDSRARQAAARQFLERAIEASEPSGGEYMVSGMGGQAAFEVGAFTGMGDPLEYTQREVQRMLASEVGETRSDSEFSPDRLAEVQALRGILEEIKAMRREQAMAAGSQVSHDE